MLRPYQQESINAINHEWSIGRNKTLLVLPTGTGKTVVFSEIAKQTSDRNERTMVLAHRGELLEQAQDKIKLFTGLDSALEKADSYALESNELVTVASMQTLLNEKRLDQFPSDYFKTIIVDEAHHVLSDGYQRILNHFHNVNVLGCTATSDRGDRKNLGQYFDSLAYEYTLPQAIKDGWLVKLKAMTIPLKIDINNVKVSQGDFQVSDIGHALEPYLEQIADEMVSICKDKHTVVFLPLIETSKKFCHLLNVRGLKAAEVNGQSPDRNKILNDFANGKYQVLCNSMLLTEGWDCPITDCIVILRPTKVRSLMAQMVGRGTRLHEGKEDCLILDFLWQTQRHDLCRPAVLIAKEDAVSKKITEKLENGEEQDLIELEEISIRDVLQERENKLAEELRKQRNKKRGLVDPLQYAYSIMDEDLTSYEPTFGFETKPVTEKQLKVLENFGINADAVKTLGHASMLIDKVMLRNKQGLSTAKQIRKLESYGFQHVGNWSKEQASKMMARIAANHWMLPHGINPYDYRP